MYILSGRVARSDRAGHLDRVAGDTPMTTNGHHLDPAQLAAKNGFPPPSPEDDHTCPHCGGPMACEYKRIIETRRAARSMQAVAQRLEEKLTGQGGKRTHEFSNEDARALYERLGTFRAVARALGANLTTVQRALLPPEQWPASFRKPRSLEKMPEGVTLTRREK